MNFETHRTLAGHGDLVAVSLLVATLLLGLLPGQTGVALCLLAATAGAASPWLLHRRALVLQRPSAAPWAMTRRSQVLVLGLLLALAALVLFAPAPITVAGWTRTMAVACAAAGTTAWIAALWEEPDVWGPRPAAPPSQT